MYSKTYRKCASLPHTFLTPTGAQARELAYKADWATAGLLPLLSNPTPTNYFKLLSSKFLQTFISLFANLKTHTDALTIVQKCLSRLLIKRAFLNVKQSFV